MWETSANKPLLQGVCQEGWDRAADWGQVRTGLRAVCKLQAVFLFPALWGPQMQLACNFKLLGAQRPVRMSTWVEVGGAGQWQKGRAGVNNRVVTAPFASVQWQQVSRPGRPAG